MKTANTKDRNTPPTAPKQLHPRNIHTHGYDFAALAQGAPELADFIHTNAQGNPGIDYSNPAAVVALNQALLACDYGIQHWRIPPGALCPPIPGRADYVHTLAELLGCRPPGDVLAARAHTNSQPAIRLLDIGTGFNGIYALLAAKVYGWEVVACDINEAAIANVGEILQANAPWAGRISLRHQQDKHQIFEGIIKPGESYDVSMCNPPFHPSAEVAKKANQRKRHNLGQRGNAPLNFGGTADELWCNGGEKLFLKKMAKESHTFSDQCKLFTSLVSDQANLKPTEKVLRKLGAKEISVHNMHQGNKKTRILSWRF
ncbi:23S rRNA (adenine(1618)-N(6))-methyltransferase RlmF [Simiduia sp. 21SJ11W-1]|uniref:23S rRNA (adenine(1618)-N(6))-methyltransferase RlmF n=1 Tax=Simiduia sp. 21SJ11W-1 TaxID=2909669 RepID=UPI00209E7CAE|nr:23S rRNA (adenine(1618)-N(6))-methyltransferase RlmF [Simiduia sp. 21SJ11W-1]UTA47309.1 23S rRNA (adenine(1618)-N(6))-methyltransferase RlmF [Simiduia sp. 21SJ11W-1]